MKTAFFLLATLGAAAACSADVHSDKGQINVPIAHFTCEVDFEDSDGVSLAAAQDEGTLMDAGPLVLVFQRENFAVFDDEFAEWFAHFEQYEGTFELTVSSLTVSWRVREPQMTAARTDTKSRYGNTGYEGRERVIGPNGRTYVRRFECYPH